MSVIEKKVVSEYFEKILKGEKTFELRLADWECQSGDILVLNEVTADSRESTGRSIRKKVGYVLKTKGLTLFTQDEVDQFGYQVISLLDEDAA